MGLLTGESPTRDTHLQAKHVLFPRNESRSGIPSLTGRHGGKKRRIQKEEWKQIITLRIFCLHPVKNICLSPIFRRNTDPATVGIKKQTAGFL